MVEYILYIIWHIEDGQIFLAEMIYYERGSLNRYCQTQFQLYKGFVIGIRGHIQIINLRH